MAIKFQYNKTSLQQLEKQLKVRVRTLPIIKNNAARETLPRWTRGWKRKSKLTKPCSPFGMSSTLH